MTPTPHPADTPSLSRWAAASAVPFALFIAVMWATLGDAPPLAWNWAWAPGIGVEAAFRVDGLALLMLALIGGIGTLVFIYAGGYMAGMPHRSRLFVTLLVFLLAMVGTVTADHLIVLLVFWEATSLASFLLVGFKHEYESARKSAQQALMVTAGGGLCLLAGAVLLGEIAGTYSISGLLASGDWQDHALTPWAFLLLGLGAITKSAQFPFHFWLPNAMAAPTPVSAYLHSATMVKLGVYLLARFDPAVGDRAWWTDPLVALGAATAFWSMLLSLRERDLKRILAWSTVSALGTLVMLIGLPGAAPPGAVAAFLLAHALYKAPLFFVAGNVDHCTGSRNIDRVCGLAPRMPWTAAAALLAAASMAGMPFSLGYAAKTMIKAAKFESEAWAWVGYSSVAVSAIAVAVAGVAAYRVFWHRRGSVDLPEVHEAHWSMRWPPLVAAALGIACGLFPDQLAAPLLDPAAAAMRGPGPIDAEGDAFEPTMLGTIGFAMAAGLALYLGWDRLHDALDRVFTRLEPLSMQAWYGRVLAAIPAAAAAITRRVQTGRIDDYLLLSAGAAAVALAAAALLLAPALPESLPLFGEHPGIALGAGLLVLVSILVLPLRSPLVLLLCSGFAGLASALVFLFAGAPDVALTQFTVEVAFIVVASVLIIRFGRGRLAAGSGPGRRAARAAVALACGIACAALLVATGAAPQDPSIAEYFGRNSVPAANGLNVVNVILVDFRAVDTLGEIAVVAAAALALLPLLKRLRHSARPEPRP